MCGGTTFVPHPGPRVPWEALGSAKGEEEDDEVQAKRATALKEFLVKKYGSSLGAFVVLDNNLSGAVTLTEFKALVVDQLRYCADKEARKLFKVLATDGVSFGYQDLGITVEGWKNAVRTARAEQRKALKIKGLLVKRPAGREASRADPECVRQFRAAMVARFGSLEEAFADLDQNLSGSLSFAEFRSGVVDRLRYCSEKEAAELFRALDYSDTGTGKGGAGEGRGLVSVEEFGIRKRDWKAFVKDPKAWRQQQRQRRGTSTEQHDEGASRVGAVCGALPLQADRSLSALDFKEVMELLSAQHVEKSGQESGQQQAPPPGSTRSKGLPSADGRAGGTLPPVSARSSGAGAGLDEADSSKRVRQLRSGSVGVGVGLGLLPSTPVLAGRTIASAPASARGGASLTDHPVAKAEDAGGAMMAWSTPRGPSSSEKSSSRPLQREGLLNVFAGSSHSFPNALGQGAPYGYADPLPRGMTHAPGLGLTPRPPLPPELPGAPRALAQSGSLAMAKISSTLRRRGSETGQDLIRPEAGGLGALGGKATPPPLAPLAPISSSAPTPGTTRHAWRPGERDAAKDAAESVDALIDRMSAAKKSWSEARRKDYSRDERQRRADEAAELVRRQPRAPFRTAV